MISARTPQHCVARGAAAVTGKTWQGRNKEWIVERYAIRHSLRDLTTNLQNVADQVTAADNSRNFVAPHHQKSPN